MLVDGDDDALHRHVQPLGGSFDNAQVGLMRHQPVQCGLVQPIGHQSFIDHRIQCLHRVLEDVVAGHHHAHTGIGLVRLEAGRYPHRVPQQLFFAAIGVHMRAEDAGTVVGLQYHRAGTVAKQHAGVAIVPVQHPGQGFRTDYQRGPGCAATDEFIRHGQRIDKARASGIDIEGRAAGHTQLALDDGGSGGKNQIRRGGADHNQVNFVRRNACRFQCAQRRLITEIRGQLACGRDMPLADAGTADDPLIAGIHATLDQVFIGQYLLRQIAAGTGDAGEDAVIGMNHVFANSTIKSGKYQSARSVRVADLGSSPD